MPYWRFGRDSRWWALDPCISHALHECDESVAGRGGEFKFANPMFKLYSGAQFIYTVRAHESSGIFFRRIVFSDDRLWNELRVGETTPIGYGQLGYYECRKRAANPAS